jgi:hypothetical protein
VRTSVGRNQRLYRVAPLDYGARLQQTERHRRMHRVARHLERARRRDEGDQAARKVHDSYAAFRERTAAWSRISLRAVLEVREG